jgi:hypothetical protein
VSILLPALSKSREQSRRVACLTLVRQHLVALNLYGADNKQLLPLAGTKNLLNPAQNIDEPDIYLQGVGGVRSGAPMGYGLLVLGGYIQGHKGLFCPSEVNVGSVSRTNLQRWEQLAYNKVATLQTAVQNNTYDAYGPSYCYRGNRWYGNNGAPSPAGQPALNGGATIIRFDPYIYSFDVGPLRRHSAVALIADSFVQGSSILGSGNADINAMTAYHRDGLNTGFSDGHAAWVPDTGSQIRTLIARAGLGYQIKGMTNEAEDVWDALDGDRGYQAVTHNYVKDLY